MKLKISIILITLFFCKYLVGQEKYLVSFPYKDLSFKEFVTKVESQLPVKFFYQENWVTDLELADYPGCTDLKCILDNLLKGKPLRYFIDDSGNVLFTGKYTVVDLNVPVSRDITLIQSSDQNRNVENEIKQETSDFVVGNPKDKDKPGKVTLTGLVLNGATGEPVAGANVFVQKLATGTTANSAGYFKLTLPRGTYQINITFIGMSEKKINLFLYGSGQMKLELNPVNVNLKEIIISTRRNLALDQFETGTERINIATIKLLPTSMGESDLMKSLILIPGVKSVGEGSAGFNVRGGSADQNLILLYDTPLYNASHFFGFFSSVNSDVIKNVTLYKGGIPGKYGGRISSVLNIETSEGNMKKIAGSAGISPVTARITAEGPLVKDALTFVFSGRTTYSNWIFSLLKDSVLHKSRASFYDLNGKITYHPDPDNTIEAASYFSHDTFSFGNNTNYNYINNIWALKLAHVFSSSLTSSVSVSNSYYRYKMTNQDTPAEAYILSHIINTTGLKADFDLSSGKNNLNFGTEINKHRVLPGNYSPADNLSQILPDVTEIEKALEAAIYIDDKFQVTKYLSFSAGVRMSSFFSLGPKTVYHYMPDFSKSSSTITDTTFYHQGKVVSRYAGPEFRTSINFRLNDNNSFKINYNRTRQYLHLLSNTASISPTDTWKLCDPYLKPEIGDQVGIGFYNYLDKNNLETSAEVYYKEIKNMIDFKGGSTITMVKNIEQNIINEKGKAYGLELTIKKTSGRARYSIGYTYSRTFVKSLGKFKDEIINSGKWYPSNYDKPHDLVMTFQYFYSRRISFTADYTYNTGRPITYPVSSYHINGILLLNYSDRNKYRIPDYSRLDIACKISGNLKTRKIAHPNLIFSVYNLLGKENTYSIYFKKIGETVKGYKLSVFGRAMPSLTLNFDF